MNIEAQILTFIKCLQALDAGTRPEGDRFTMIGIALVLAELADIRAELRQDLAALGDELAGHRRHTNDHLAAIQSELLHRLGRCHPK